MLAGSHNDLREALTITPQAGLMELARLAGVIPDSKLAPKRKPGRPKSKGRGFWLQTESGLIHVLGDPALADDPEFRTAMETMAKAAKAEAERFNEAKED